MLTVEDRFPEFKLHGVVSLERGHEFQEITRSIPSEAPAAVGASAS
jgi:hypothetical protein